MKPLRVKSSQVSLRLSENDVAGLMPGAPLERKSGQANVRVERRDSLIYITATCDSLLFLIESRDREIVRLKEVLESRVTEKSPAMWDRIKTGLVYFVIGLVVGELVRIFKR